MALLPLLAFALPALADDAAQTRPTTCPFISFSAAGRLEYAPYTPEGDRILDFSNCGYGGGGVALPAVPVRLTLKPQMGDSDDTARIQAALDAVARMPLDGAGLRGAVLLTKGRYRIATTLRLSASGVILRGQGQGEDGTVLIATGTDRRPLIEVGARSAPAPVSASRRVITTRYVPVGARQFDIADATPFKAGDVVVVSRVGNADWIHALGMDQIPPRPDAPNPTRQWEPFNLLFDRVVTAIKGNRITLDAPIACAIDARWGGGEICRCEDTRPERIGVEDLRGQSEFDPAIRAVYKEVEYAADEEHSWEMLAFRNVRNAWALRLTAVHFAYSAVKIGGGAKWVTARDCSSLDPVSLIDGSRRYAFNINGGQLCLFDRCYSDRSRHAFVVGSHVAGPNVFLDCRSEHDYFTSEPHHRWSVGGLYDNVHAPIAVQDRQNMGTGHGWAGANYVLWNCEGSLICQRPPTAQNFAFGCVGPRPRGAFFPRPEGLWYAPGQHIAPRSLYLQQLKDRLGK